MSEKNSPSWEPEPGPQNELERVMLRAMEDPAEQGKFFRLLWESELHTFVPDHPEVRGEFKIQNGSELNMHIFSDKDGTFVPLYTSGLLAERAALRAPKPKPAIASTLGEVLFRMLNDGELKVRVYGPKGAYFALGPGAVESIVNGEFRHAPLSETPGEPMTVFHVPAEELPSKLREAVRVFCARRRVALGVYAFHPADKATGGPNEKELDFMLWLREDNTEFHNDFRLMVGRLAPKGLEVGTSLVNPEDAPGMAFLQKCPPLWPIVKKE